jgi:hypothetical protein
VHARGLQAITGRPILRGIDSTWTARRTIGLMYRNGMGKARC